MSAKPVKPRAHDKYCYYGICKNKLSKCVPENIKFIPFPKPTTTEGAYRAQRWIAACRRESLTLTSINNHTYVCSLHFIDPNGPTPSNPDPVQATCAMVPGRRNQKHQLSECDINSQPYQQKVKVIKIVANYDEQPRSQLLQSTRDMAVQTEQCNHSAATQTERPNCSNEASPTVIFFNLVQEVMKHFKDWFVKYDIGRSVTAAIVKLVKFEITMTVLAKLNNDTFNMSIMIGQYKLEQGHPFWANHKQSTNTQGIITLLHDLSDMKICLKLEKIHRSERSKTTTCKLLCEAPSLICSACKEVASQSKTCIEFTKPPKPTVTNMHMSNPMLLVKMAVMKKTLRNVQRQNERLRAKIAK